MPNGSPFEAGKEDVRLQLAAARVGETGLPLIYLNQVGGQDELVFDGASFVLNADRSLALALPAWEEAVAVSEWTARRAGQMGLRAGRHRRAAKSRESASLSRHDAGPARLCEQEPLSRRGAGAVGRHRFRAVGGGGGGCAWAPSACAA